MPKNTKNPHARPAPFERYALQDQDAARKASMAAELSTDHRLHLAAVDRINDYGHAVFQPGELRKILAKIDMKTGELKPISRQAVTDAKRKLYLAGLLEENTGGEQCIWLKTARRWDSRLAKCPHHRNCKAVLT